MIYFQKQPKMKLIPLEKWVVRISNTMRGGRIRKFEDLECFRFNDRLSAVRCGVRAAKIDTKSRAEELITSPSAPSP